MPKGKKIEEFNEDKYYMYRHIRHDKNEIFYVGIGTKSYQNKSIEKRYNRAYSIKSRNIIWQNIVAKTTYEVEIFITSNDLGFIKKKENEFINIYGRRDLGTGTLANLTDGGELNDNISKETWEKRKQSYINSGNYKKMIDRFSTTYRKRKGDNMGVDSPVRKDVYVYSLGGVFLKHFYTKSECSKELKIAPSSIYNYIDKSTNIKEYIIKSVYSGDILNIKDFNIVVNRKIGNDYQKKVGCTVIDINTGHEYEFDRLSNASLFLGFDRSWIYTRIKRNSVYYKNYKIEVNAV